jgi:hypothetical protein
MQQNAGLFYIFIILLHLVGYLFYIKGDVRLEFAPLCSAELPRMWIYALC